MSRYENHSANEKTVRYLGTATTMGSEIDKKLFEDTGIKVKYIPVTTDEVTKKGSETDPTALTSLMRYLMKTSPVKNILGMDSKRIKEFDNISTTHRRWVKLAAKKSVIRALHQKRFFI